VLILCLNIIHLAADIHEQEVTLANQLNQLMEEITSGLMVTETLEAKIATQAQAAGVKESCAASSSASFSSTATIPDTPEDARKIVDSLLESLEPDPVTKASPALPDDQRKSIFVKMYKIVI